MKNLKLLCCVKPSPQDPEFDQELQGCKQGQQHFPGLRSASVLGHEISQCAWTPLESSHSLPPLNNSLWQAARTIPRRAIESNAFSIFRSNMSGFPYKRQLLELLITLFFTTSPLSCLWALLSPPFLPYVLRQAVRQSCFFFLQMSKIT